ncbi:MAG: stalk domain-containing protein [bacterium]|nr:stalk domain-containing protein [bacterium]
MRNSFSKKLKKAAAFSIALVQVGTLGIAVPTVTANAQAAATVTRNMENLDRGVVAMKVDNGTYISWRRLGTEPASTNFELYRNQEKIAEGPITNYSDPDGQLGDSYTVVCNGTMSEPFEVLEDNYIEIPMAETPQSDTMITDRNGIYYGAYTPGDGTYGDLDGDGQYEIIVLWCPPDAKDAASGGRTGKAYIDAYKMDGTFMWRIDMGYNIRAGAHDTMLMVEDFNNDGKAEMILRTSDGTIDGQGNMIGDASKGTTYEDSWAALNGGKNLQGPLYVTCFEGETGKALDTIDFYPQNTIGSMETCYSFGDDFGNRCERYNSTIAYLDGVTPSVVMGRGYYFGKNGRQRQAAAAYSFKNNKLTCDWKFDTESSGEGYKSGYEKYVGQGNHQLEAADVDGDGFDEVTTGALWYDQDGTVLWSSQLEHGDVVHVGDFLPTNPGLEVMTSKEDYSDEADKFDYYLSPELSSMGFADALGADLEVHRQVWGHVFQDAKTGRAIQIVNGTKDTGRGMIANIGYGDSYYVMWGAAGTGYQDDKGTKLPDLGLSMNGRIYWDGDLQDELQDHRGAGKEIVISKYNDTTKKGEDLFVPADTHSINSTKGNTCGQGDMIGDWREEFVTYVIKDSQSADEKMTIKGNFDKDVEVTVSKTVYQYALRIYTTNIPTEYNFYTLAHDDVYRNTSGTYNNCYNQPPHISWYMNDKIEGSEYTTQPDANIKLVANKYTAPAFDASKLPAAGERKPSASKPSTPASNAISVKLNGTALSFDVAPQIINDRTMVPMRKIFESLGATVEWDQDTKTVTSTKGDKTITMTIDNPEMKVNDSSVTLDSAPTIVDDRTLVPVRAIAEAFGSTVDWDGDTKTVTIADGSASSDPASPDATPAPAPASFKGYDFAPEVPAYSSISGVTVLSEGMTSFNTFQGVYKNDLQSYITYITTINNAGFNKTVNGKTTTYTKGGTKVVVVEGDETVTVAITK